MRGRGLTDMAGRRAVAWGDVAALAAILALVAAAGLRSVSYGLWTYGEPGAGLFPLIACAVAGICGALALAGALAGREVAVVDDGDAAQQDGPVLWGKLVLYGAVVLAWPWLLVPLGFVLSTVIALFVVLRLAEGMGWRMLAVVLAVAVAASWLLFDRLLGVPLPPGILGIG